MHEQPIDLILRALYDSEAGVLSSATLQTFEGSGFTTPFISDGFGAPVLVGRHSDLDLTLDVLDVQQPGTIDVTIETAASSGAARWRKLGAFPQVSAIGSSALSLSGADAWVRCRYKPSAGASFALGVSGRAHLIVLAAASHNSSSVGPVIDLAQYRSVRLLVDATAVAGTLSVSLETASRSTAATWRTVATAPTITAAGSCPLPGFNLDRYVRVRWDVAGVVTFGVSGIARLTLAQTSDRARMGIGGGAFPSATPEDDDDALYAATADVLGAFAGRYQFPLRSWDDDTREACIRICDWKKIANRGTEPGKKLSAEETVYYERYAHFASLDPARLGWIYRVAARTAHPSGLVDSATPEPQDGEIRRVVTASTPLRGWGRRVAIR